MESQRLAVAKNFRRAPLGREHAAVGGELEPRREHRLHRLLALFDQRRIEQLVRRTDVEVVSEVEVVRDERYVDGRALQLHVQIAEWHRMGGCGRGRDQETGDKYGVNSPFHGEQW